MVQILESLHYIDLISRYLELAKEQLISDQTSRTVNSELIAVFCQPFRSDMCVHMDMCVEEVMTIMVHF